VEVEVEVEVDVVDVWEEVVEDGEWEWPMEKLLVVVCVVIAARLRRGIFGGI